MIRYISRHMTRAIGASPRLETYMRHEHMLQALCEHRSATHAGFGVSCEVEP